MPAKSSAERLAVVETQVTNLNEKVEDIKVNVGAIHEVLGSMRKDASDAHEALAAKISELEKFKSKWVYTIAGGVAVFGIVIGHLDKLNHIIK